MIWLFPLYLLGAGAVIGPILMHLRKKPPQHSMEFSSLMFLDAQTPVPVSKRRLEHWLLLLLRCLALLLLALMFARPLWHSEKAPVNSQGAAIAILVDQSASMRRADLWKQAVARAEKVIQGAKPEDRLMLATFDGAVHSRWSFDEDKTSSTSRVAALKQRLGQAHPGWGGTDIGKALQETVATFSSAASMAGRKKQIVLISDLQEGAKLEALRGLVWPENIKVSLQRVEAPNLDNMSLALAANAPETETGATVKTAAATSAIRIRIANSRESKVADFHLAWEKMGGEVLAGYLPPGASRVLPAPPMGESTAAKTLLLTGDAWDFDNRIYVAPLQPKPVRIVFIGDENTRNETASPLYYLSRALQSTAALAPELLVIPPTAKTLPPGSSIAFASGAVLSESLAASLRAFIEQGGLCIEVLDSAAETTQAAVQDLSGSADLALREGDVPAGGYRMLSEVDGTHLLLRPFADERLRDFTKLRFWKYRHLELGPKAGKELKVIAKFDNGDPAIVARDIGKGHLALLAFGWDPRESQLALSTKFVPLLYGWLEAAGFRNDEMTSLLVGDALPADAGAKVVTPEQQTLTVKTDAPLRAEMTGLYSITPPSGGRAVFYAVNLPPEEGRITPLDPDQFRQLGIRLEASDKTAGAAQADDEREHLGVTEEEKQQRAWMWILAGVLMVLAAETWLANRLRPGEEMQPAGA